MTRVLRITFALGLLGLISVAWAAPAASDNHVPGMGGPETGEFETQEPETEEAETVEARAPGTDEYVRQGMVVVDPGHGGYDFGISEGELREKEVVLDIARLLTKYLESEENEVLMTRTVDQYRSLLVRREAIEEASPGLAISVHLSGSERCVIYVALYPESIRPPGLKEFYAIDSRQSKYLFRSKRLAEILAEVLGQEFGWEVRISELPLPVLMTTGAPAVMVELPSKGFAYGGSGTQRVAFALGIGVKQFEAR